jgi:hypothetical protein
LEETRFKLIKKIRINTYLLVLVHVDRDVGDPVADPDGVVDFVVDGGGDAQQILLQLFEQ